MRDVIEVSYTGDVLAHRRCPRAWAYEKQAGFHPYEQVQAMEGRLIHHAMEWLTGQYSQHGRHATKAELEIQLQHHFRVLWARGIRTSFESKQSTLDRILNNLYPKGMHPTVRVAIEGAKHTEYELRTVKALVKKEFAGKSKLLLTGVLDLVVQHQHPLTYERVWMWNDERTLDGKVVSVKHSAAVNDLEIWDYKGSRATTPYKPDYVRQLLTYAALYSERTRELPKRCVLFFINEAQREEQLLAIPLTKPVVDRAFKWTMEQVKYLRTTVLDFENNPCSVTGGDFEKRRLPVGQRTDGELKKQCTACGFRFDCAEYVAYLGGSNHPDVRVRNIFKN